MWRGTDRAVAPRLGRAALLGLPGLLSINGRGTYVDKLETSSGSAPIDRAGDVRVGSQPRWRWNAQADYTLGPVALNLQGRWGRMRRNF